MSARASSIGYDQDGFAADSPFTLGRSAEMGTETETETEFEGALAEAHAFDPYASIRPALQPEHAAMPADELSRVVGREPALVALHRLLDSPQPQQSALAVLLGKAGRRSVRVQGADMPVPAYLRLLSHLCREAAEHTEQELAPQGKPAASIRNLLPGSIGPDVEAVQTALNSRAPAGLAVDGKFGAQTRAAVVAFQQRNALQVDGVVGPQTRHALFPLVGVTVHLVGGYPAAGRPVAAGNAHPAMTGEDPTSFGDWPGVPNQSPSDTILQLLLKHLPGQDPSGGPLDSFLRPDQKLDLPIPPLLTAPLLNIPGMQLTSKQLQPGFQFNTPHFWQSRGGSPNPSGTLVLAVQSVLALDKDKPGHLEVAEGFQLGAPLFAQTSDGTDWTLQWFAQATWVDPFWQRGRWHLVQPFAQISTQVDLKSADPTLGVGLFPVNISVELIKDKLSVFGQGGVVAGWDIGANRLEVGGQVIGGLNVTLGGK